MLIVANLCTVENLVFSRCHISQRHGCYENPLFDGKGSRNFAFGCVTGTIYGAGDTKNVTFSWIGNDEIAEAEHDRAV